MASRNDCLLSRPALTCRDVLRRIFEVAIDSVDAHANAEQEVENEHCHVHPNEHKSLRHGSD